MFCIISPVAKTHAWFLEGQSKFIMFLDSIMNTYLGLRLLEITGLLADLGHMSYYELIWPWITGGLISHTLFAYAGLKCKQSLYGMADDNFILKHIDLFSLFTIIIKWYAYLHEYEVLVYAHIIRLGHFRAVFHWIGPLSRFIHRVVMSVCVSVCVCDNLKHPLQGGLETSGWRVCR